MAELDPDLNGAEGDESFFMDSSTNNDTKDQSGLAGDNEADDPELQAIKARVKEMEEEAEKLKEMQNEVEKSVLGSSSAGSSEDKAEADARSVYVGNVDYAATAEELEQHFHGCGSVHRVTILCDKFSGHPKGFAYIEFSDKESIKTAMALDDSLFRGRQIKVSPKRTNRPGISSTDRGFRRARRPSRYGGVGGPRRRSRFRRNVYRPY